MDLGQAARDGWRQRLGGRGPEGCAAWLRAQTTVPVTDTTFRDAHQSPLATRVRTRDPLAAAPPAAPVTPGLLPVAAWGGPTAAVAPAFLL